MNNKKVTICILVLLVFGLGYSNFSNKKEISQPNNNEDKLEFNIDLENLSYQLPPHRLICIPESKQFCSSSNNCESVKAEVFLLIDEIGSKYSRCDNQPCDTYDSTFIKSGIYTIISPLPPNHGEIKIAQDGTYIETNTLGDSVYISIGVCQKTAN